MKPLQLLYLVDSHLDSLQIQSILSEGGILSEIILVDNEQTFTCAIEKNNFDIIFTDYRIPCFDGMSALRIATEKCPHIPVIFITDKFGEEFAVETLHYGAVDYILKNSIKRLVPAVKRALKITEERKKLKEAEERFRNIVENTSNWIWEYDKDGFFTYSNSRVRNILGYEPEEILGKKAFDFMGGNYEKTEVPGLFPSEAVMQHRNGSVIELETKTIPFYNEDGTLIKGYHAISVDITDRKNMERESKKINEELEDRVIDRTIQLAVLNRELKNNIEERKKIERELVIARNIAESASIAKSDFIASMSHELRTPLNSILGYAQLFLNDGSLIEEQRRGINIILKSGNHLLGLINDVMDMAKIEGEDMKLSETPFNLPVMLDFVRSVIEVNATKKDLLFFCDYSSLLPDIVTGDEKRLSQILMNLLSNAVKFTEKGHIRLKVDKNEEKIVFSVEDTGVGIPEDKLKDIFQPFKQITPMLKKTDGTGLGLSISRKLVRLMGGELSVESCLGKSSRFWFSLDLPEVSAEEMSELSNGNTISGYKGDKRRILIVDDKDWNRDVIAEFLTGKGFEVEEAGSGLQCMDKLNSFKPDLIFMDIIMPDMDGFETTKSIRAMSEYKDIKIIALSATSPEEWYDNRVAIFDAFISKPFFSQSLLDIIKETLELEWIYIEEERNYISSDKEVILIPPFETMETLYNYIRDGNIKSFNTELTRVNIKGNKYEAFYENLKDLSENFEIERLVKLLEKYIEKEQPYGN